MILSEDARLQAPLLHLEIQGKETKETDLSVQEWDKLVCVYWR